MIEAEGAMFVQKRERECHTEMVRDGCVGTWPHTPGYTPKVLQRGRSPRRLAGEETVVGAFSLMVN